jgi:ParB/RepB/Spo0J family partition protein
MASTFKNEEVGIAIIPVEMIRKWDKNPREFFDEKELAELASSIAEVGVLEPILVRQVPVGHPSYEENTFLIVAGERRYRASILAGEKVIPCIRRELDDKQALEIAIIENLQRSEVHPLHEANGFLELQKQGYETKDLAAKFGIDESTVLKRLKLLDLLPEYKKMFYTGKIKIGHALIICRLRPELQKECLRYMEDDSDYHNEFPGIAALKEFIESNIQMSLDKVGFDTKDENLIKGCGACTNCPKRSGANPLLFDDMTQKGDVCMDRICFDKKNDAHIEVGYQEAISNKLAIVAGYDYEIKSSVLQENYPGVLLHNQWRSSKKADGGIKAFCVSGNDKGKTIYVKPINATNVNGQVSIGKKHSVVIPAAAQISAIKQRLERAKELDAEKVHEAAIAKAKKVVFPKLLAHSPNPFFNKMFILFLYDEGKYGTDGELSKPLMGKKVAKYHTHGEEPAFAKAVFKDPSKLADSLFNTFMQDLITRYSSAKGTSDLQKYMMHQVFTEYDKLIGYSKILADQKVIADKRQMRADQRIKALKADKGTKEDKKPSKAVKSGDKLPTAKSSKKVAKAIKALLKPEAL